jgi:hypothetical protein
MNQKLSGALILSADIDSRRASVLPQALQDKVQSAVDLLVAAC